MSSMNEEQIRANERKRIRVWCEWNDLDRSVKKVMDAYERANLCPAPPEPLHEIPTAAAIPAWALNCIIRRVNEQGEAIERLRKH